MSKSLISTGINPNDGNGDTLLAGAGKVNSNFNEIYSTLGNGTDLSIGVGKTIISTNAQGNVGIKTTNPTSELYVSGNQYVTGILTATSLFGNIVGSSGTITNLTGTAGTITTLNSTNGTITTLTGTNLNYTGISSVGSLSIGSTEVISSARQLKNITSLDATTKATIESSIQLEPNNFSDLQVTGVSTFTNGPVLIGTGTSTGTVNQDLQIIGGAYISDNVGIGTTNPTSRLFVTQPGTSHTTSELNTQAFAVSSGNTGRTMWMGYDDGIDAGFINAARLGQSRPIYLQTRNLLNATTVFVGIGTTEGTGTANQVLQVGRGGYFRGNLGVGHTNPTSALDVVGNGEFTGSVVGAALSVSGISTFRNGPVLIGTATSTGTASQPLQVTGGAYVSGNLGVGITNPSYKLDVSGVARLGFEVAQGAPSSSNITTNAHTLLSGTGSNFLTIGQYGASNSYAQWIQSGFSNPSTATYNIVLQPLGGNVCIGASLATGTASQRLQVTGGGYFSDSIGLGATNPTSLLHIGPGTISRSQLEFSSGSLLTSPSAGVVEYDGTTLFATPNTSYGRASIPTTIYTSGAGTILTTSSEATAQILFPSANDTISLPIGTYRIEFGISMTRSATSTTAATLNVTLNGFGSGSAGTFSGIADGTVATTSASGIPISGSSITSSIPISVSTSTASAIYTISFTGILRITTAGTFQPRYSLSANLGGASGSNAISAGNYLILQSLATSGSSVATGAWA
jgi:hypothetical protein